MRRRAGAAGILVLAAVALPLRARGAAADGAGAPPPAAAPAPDPDAADGPVPFVDAVNKAIDRGIAWLKGRQDGLGTWGAIGGDNYFGGADAYRYPSGTAALGAYTLLKCGVPVTDPVVKKAFDALKARATLPDTAYEASMTLLAVTATADPFKRVGASEAAGEKVKLDRDMRHWARDLVESLKNRRAKGAKGWRYNDTHGLNDEERKYGAADLSSTQLAALALFAAERCGIPVDSALWDDLIDYALSQQEKKGPDRPRALASREAEAGAAAGKPSGAAPNPYAAPSPERTTTVDHARGFSYMHGDALPRDEGTATGSMTACGLGTLLMSRYVLLRRNDRVWTKRDAAALQQSVYDGFAWLDEHWSPFDNPPRVSGYFVYYLYGVERAMDLTGCVLLGSHNWYVEMGKQLLEKQEADGHWDSKSAHPPGDVLDTCFALLFLKRATRGGIPYPSVTGGSDDPPVDTRKKPEPPAPKGK